MSASVRITSVLTIAALAGGCATTQVPPGQARPVPQERLLSAPSVGQADIVVVRDSGLMGGGCYYLLSVNKAPAARMDTGEKVSLRVPAGDLLLTVGRDPDGKALCGLEPDHKVQREFSIRAGEVKHFRMLIGNGGMDVMRSDY
jgi:hypothetical protein